MTPLRTRGSVLMLALLTCLTVAGCYEDKAHITINADGSGTFEQTVRMSEQLVVSVTSEDNQAGMSSDMPFDMERAEFEDMLGGAATIESFDVRDLDDGGKLITVKGRFDDAATFFQSEYADERLNLGIAADGEGRATLSWVANENQGGDGPSMDQMYGLAKGLKIVRQVTLPSAPESDAGTVNGNQIEWALDLSNRETLAATKAMLDQPDPGVLTAHFDPGTINFVAAVPETAIGSTTTSAREDVAAAPVDTSGMAVRVNSVGWTRIVELDGDSFAQNPSLNSLYIEMELTWPEDRRPLAYYPGKLTALADDLENDLVPEEDANGFGQRRQDVWEHSDSETFRVEAESPELDADALVGLSGTIRVVTQVNLNTVSLDNPTALAGKASTGDASLDELGFKIKSVEGSDLSVSFKDGVDATETIQSLTATLPDGTVVESNGWGGWANEMTYNFPQDISAMKNLTLEIVAGETVVAVPFGVDWIKLP